MFDWFSKYRRPKYPTWDDVPDLNKVSNDMNKVIPFFPEVVKTPPVPEVEPPKEKPAYTYYRLGLTNNNRVSLAMGYSEVTLSATGVDNLIAQLEVFRNQLQDIEDQE